MSRALVVIRGQADRARALDWCAKAPTGTRIEFKAGKRSLPQNSLFWARLGDIATQVEWHGMKLKTSDWKLIFMDALKGELRMVPNINGNGFVNLGRSSSDLTKDEMSDLIEIVGKFGAEHGVQFADDKGEAP